MRAGAAGSRIVCLVAAEKLVENIAGALRPGRVAIFHEYSDYLTFRFMPIKPALEKLLARGHGKLDCLRR